MPLGIFSKTSEFETGGNSKHIGVLNTTNHQSNTQRSLRHSHCNTETHSSSEHYKKLSSPQINNCWNLLHIVSLLFFNDDLSVKNL